MSGRGDDPARWLHLRISRAFAFLELLDSGISCDNLEANSNIELCATLDETVHFPFLFLRFPFSVYLSTWTFSSGLHLTCSCSFPLFLPSEHAIEPNMAEQDGDRVTKPTDAHGLVLEAWGQGLMIGSLVIMAAITLSNMKKNILLHKLIFAEVRLKSPKPLDQRSTLLNRITANPRHGPRHLHIPPRAQLRLVPLRNRSRAQRLLGLAQRDSMDEKPPLLLPPCLVHLRRDRHALLALLDHRDLCQFHLLQQYQQDLPQD